jgi:hypothetical protein
LLHIGVMQLGREAADDRLQHQRSRVRVLRSNARLIP